MRIFFISILCIVLSSSASAQTPEANIDVVHYSFTLKVSDKDDSLHGVTDIRFRRLKAAGEVAFDLASVNQEGKGMKVSGVTDDKKPLEFNHSNNKLYVTLNAGDTASKNIQVTYAGIPADGLIISKTKYGRRSFFADNWPDRAKNWLVCVDHPADKAAVDFFIKAPAHYQVVANGMLIEESNVDANYKLTHYRETLPLPTKIMTVGIADFAVQYIDLLPNVRLSSWVYPEDREKGFYDFEVAKDIIPFFENKIAPFPYRKLANVQSKTIFGGLENAGAIFYSENLITGKRTGEPTVAHEIAHQWFGDMATEADFSHLWLSEGFATYLTIYYMEQKHGVDSANKLLARDRQQVIDFAARKPRPVVDSAVDSYMDLLNANSYQKGSWILHMLRNELGDDVFWKGVQRYYNKFAGKNAITADLQKAMEDVSGKDLRQFFYQWLFIAGQPELKIDWKYNAGNKTVSLVIEQQQEKLFHLPMEIRVLGGNSKTLKVLINKKRFVTEIPVTFQPSAIAVDERVKLLYKSASK